MSVAFACAKTTHIFFSKNTCELDIVLTRTVNILTINGLVKLTMLSTPGPRSACSSMLSDQNLCRALCKNHFQEDSEDSDQPV